ncbi:MAG: dephospho-CoA kinase [Bacteroidales bacterium]|nr:dephospho-CoA kinase [Bacteroidales bacterium]
MYKVGITGNIGSGKTLVGSVFKLLKIPVFNADLEAKALYREEDIRKKVIQFFGSAAYLASGYPDTAFLAERIFHSPESLTFIQNLLHPAVRFRFESWCEKYQNQIYVLYEAAILFETGKNKDLDKIIYVAAPESLRISRLMMRDNATLKDIRLRMNKQWPDDVKIPLSDYIIHNNEIEMLIPQILKVHKDLIHVV